MPVSRSAAGPDDSSGPSDRSIASLVGSRYSVLLFARPSMTTIARGAGTPVR